MEKLYVDLLPSDGILCKVLERKTTFLIGRKGTGKSTVFSRTQHEIHKNKKDISVYINTKSIYKDCESNSVSTDLLGVANKFSDNEMLKLTLLKKLIESLSKSLSEELDKEEYGILQRITNKFLRNTKLETAISDLNKLETIKLDSGKFSIKSIDLYDVYGRDNNIPDTGKLAIFVQENLKNSIVYTAQKNKYELTKQSNSYFEGLTEAPTSHFTIPPNCEQYLEELEFNGFVHKLNNLASKGREKDRYNDDKYKRVHRFWWNYPK